MSKFLCLLESCLTERNPAASYETTEDYKKYIIDNFKHYSGYTWKYLITKKILPEFIKNLKTLNFDPDTARGFRQQVQELVNIYDFFTNKDSHDWKKTLKFLTELKNKGFDFGDELKKEMKDLLVFKNSIKDSHITDHFDPEAMKAWENFLEKL